MDVWSKFLCEERFKDLLVETKPDARPEGPGFAKGQFRLPHERDHDRILFSTPFRRMGDKTQVFPLESIESIRTRLTHSYEVANLARSLGIEIAIKHQDRLPVDAIRKIPAILAAVGLAHDIGNPPFGHQGENAIRAWFQRNARELFTPPDKGKFGDIHEDVSNLTEQHKNDFLKFEGNAQTLRVLTKLQVIGDDLGLNLTLGTLSSIMKYVSSSDQTDKEKHSRKKVGFFASEAKIVEKIRQYTGLQQDARHPLALVMEACDDIAYSVLDAEDAIKKGLASLNDLLSSLEYHPDGDNKIDSVVRHLCELSRWEYDKLREQNLPPSELQDVATQKFRVHAIHLMVAATAEAFDNNYNDIVTGSFSDELIKKSKASELCRALKEFDRKNAFSHKTVLEVELNGYNTLNRLMDFLWMGISERRDYRKLDSDRTSPFSTYVYSRISKNYRRIFEGKVVQYHQDVGLPIRYKEMQLLTDMVSGMTDQFCIDLHDDLLKHYRKMQPINGTPS
ncbi:dGTP triphosphohydrolase [Nitratireductor sp. L15S-10]|uniref:dGTP triphosphohydrolase n=1 Tax=Nitratireductor sp. L15S-10 TaxID=3034028 RepID=UPI003857BBC6